MNSGVMRWVARRWGTCGAVRRCLRACARARVVAEASRCAPEGERCATKRLAESPDSAFYRAYNAMQCARVMSVEVGGVSFNRVQK